MVRSSGFGSINNDKRPFQTRFRYGSSIFYLNQAITYKSPAHSSTGTQSNVKSFLLLLVSLWFHVLFHSPPGVLFTFPSRYCFTIGHSGIFSLTRWSSLIHTEFHVLHATRDTSTIAFSFQLQDYHFLWYTIPGTSSN